MNFPQSEKFYQVFGKGQKSERGMVLLLVLSIFAFAAVVAGELSYQSHREIRRTSNMLTLDEAYLFAKGGETFAIQKLQSDFHLDKQKGLTVDYLTEAWSIQSKPYELDAKSLDGSPLDSGNLVDEGFLKDGGKSDPLQDIGKMIIVIEDLQARFNVNNVQYSKEGSIKGVDQFESVINAVIGNGIQLAAGSSIDDVQYPDVEQSLEFDIPPADLARAVQDWVDKDDESQLPSGSEDSFYSDGYTSYRTASQDIADVTELMAITGFSENDYQLYNMLMPKRFTITQSADAGEEGEEGVSEESEEEQDAEVSYDQFGNPIIKLIPAAEKYWGGIQHYLSALPFPSTINVNTAPVEVLQALFTGEQADIIVQNRKLSPYKKVGDIFFNITSIKKQEDRDQYMPYLSVNSNYFLSTVTASIGETNYVLRSTLYRDKDGNIRVLKREFGR